MRHISSRFLAAAASTISLALISLAFGLGAASHAYADTTFSLIAGTAADRQAFHQEQSADSSGERVNVLHISDHPTPGNVLVDALAAAQTRSAAGLMQTHVRASFQTQDFTEVGFINMRADAIFTDSITIGQATDTPQFVTLHNVLTVLATGTSGSEGFANEPGNPPASPTAHVENLAELDITGSGTGAGPFGPAVFGSFGHHLDASGGVSGIGNGNGVNFDNAAPFTIDFTQRIQLGVPTDIRIEMLLTSTLIAEDVLGLLGPGGSIDYGFNLDWGGQTVITADDANGVDTGRVVRGLTGVSASGFDFLGDQGVAAVPEPTSWAMMIGGVLMSGAMFRRRRAARLLV